MFENLLEAAYRWLGRGEAPPSPPPLQAAYQPLPLVYQPLPLVYRPPTHHHARSSDRVTKGERLLGTETGRVSKAEATALWKGMAARGYDKLALLAAADWYAEKSAKPGDAADLFQLALRWCAAAGKRPHLRREDGGPDLWSWVREGTPRDYLPGVTADGLKARIPAEVFDARPGRPGSPLVHADHAWVLYHWLGEALHELRKVLKLTHAHPLP